MRFPQTISTGAATTAAGQIVRPIGCSSSLFQSAFGIALSPSIPDWKANSKVFSHKYSFSQENFRRLALHPCRALREQEENRGNVLANFYARKTRFFYCSCRFFNEFFCENGVFISENSHLSLGKMHFPVHKGLGIGSKPHPISKLKLSRIPPCRPSPDGYRFRSNVSHTILTTVVLERRSRIKPRPEAQP